MREIGVNNDIALFSPLWYDLISFTISSFMFKGIFYALAACFIWGLIFVIPGLMPSFTPFEIVLGRYLMYGLLSCILFFRIRFQGLGKYSKEVWFKSFLYSLATNIIYYTCLGLGLSYSTPAICALILGLSPITIALYGNWQQKEVSFQSLIFPSCLIMLGLVLINFPQLQGHENPASFLWGLFFASLSLISWSWFVVANSRFLKANPHVNSTDWSNMLGVSTLVWAFMLCLTLWLFFPQQLHLNAYLTWSTELKQFLIGCSILGIVCSWVGTALWNKASFYLPVSLAGQLTIFETIFGVLFFYILERKIPPLLECLGIVLFLLAIILGIKKFSYAHAPAKQLPSE